MSRFVPAGSAQDAEDPATTNDDAWAKAREKIDSTRHNKPARQGEQDDGRSLYEVLQANKAAKQEAFEEAAKLKNQFRPLDDSEIEFLDSVRDAERMNEAAVKQEAAEQLDAFRKQRALADQQAKERELAPLSRDSHTRAGDQLLQTDETRTSWTASKKRRRVVEASEELHPTKLRKEPTGKDPLELGIKTAADVPKPKQSSKTNVGDAKIEKETAQHIDTTGSKPIMPVLGLVAYDSDDED